ncbi:MAG: tyrosine-type recombinase/integrase [Nitrososphaeraceae archaeon]
MTSTYVLNNKSCEDYYRRFKEAIKSKDTFLSYTDQLKVYIKYRGIADGQYFQLIEDKDTRTIEDDIIDFIISLKERNYSLASQKACLSALIHFYSINNLVLNRKKIGKFLSSDDVIIVNNNNNNLTSEVSQDQGSGDKPYTYERIAKLLEFSDIRTKVIILIMSSAGLRLGALPTLKIGDLIPIPKHNLYQIRVYANSKSNRHYTFCTPECRKAIDNYIEFRESCGENITPRSPLLRREFDRNDIFQIANNVRPLTRDGIKKSLNDVLYASGLRAPIVKEKNSLNTRRETAMSHGFRKFFDTWCTNSGMNQTYVDFCLGHSLPGVKDSYFLPQADSNGVYLDILEGHDKSPGYTDPIDYLTINEENRLRRKVQQLTIDVSEIQAFKKELDDLKEAFRKSKEDE